MGRTLVFDTDIGTNPDDFFALLMVCAQRQVDVGLIITGNRFPQERAQFVRKILQSLQRRLPVYAGESTGCVDFFAQHFLDSSSMLLSSDYLPALKELAERSDEISYVAVQGLSNLSKFVKHFPQYLSKLHVVHLGATLKGAKEGFISGGTNVEADPLATKYVYESGVNLRIIGTHTTINNDLRVSPLTSLYQKLHRSSLSVHQILFQHLQEYYVRRGIWPALHDPLAVSVALGKPFVEFEKVSLLFRKDGKYRLGGKTVLSMSKPECDAEAFMQFLERLLF